MQKFMKKIRMFSMLAVVFVMALACTAKAEAASYKRVGNFSDTMSYADDMKKKVGKYYFWCEEGSGRDILYCSKSSSSANAAKITQSSIGTSVGPILTNGTYIWFVEESEADVIGNTVSKLYRCKMNGKGKKLYKKFKTSVGRGITLAGCTGKTIFYSVYGNKGDDTVLYSISVKSKNGKAKKVKTTEIYAADGGNYIYLKSKKSTTAMLVYNIKTKKTRTIKKSKNDYVYYPTVLGSKLYYGTSQEKDGADVHKLYQMSLSGKSRKLIASNLPASVYELKKVDAKKIYYKDFFGRGYIYDRTTKTCVQYNRVEFRMILKEAIQWLS